MKKVKTKDRSRSKAKFSSKDKTATASYKGNKTQKLQTKLISAFLIPIVLFICTGVLTYSVTSSALMKTYEKSTMTSMTTLSDYYSIVIYNVELMAKRLAVNNGINNYYSGGVGQTGVTINDVKFAITNEAIADQFIDHIMILSPNGQCCWEKGKMNGNVYEAFTNSEEGQRIAELGERAECWIDSHKGLDEEMGGSTETYALSYVKAMTGSGGRISGYIIIDVKRSFIEEILAKAKVCSGSQEAFVISNGIQIEANAGKVIFAEQPFYQTALEEENIQGFSYEKVAGKEFLFSYQKFSEDMVVCSLIPKDEIMASVRMVMIVTILAIMLCTMVSVIVGTTIAKNISKALYSVNGVLKKTSEGDLTGKVAVKRKDEFATLGANLTETIKGMKSLIMKMTHVSQDVSGSAEAVNSNSRVLLDVTEHISHAVGDINQGIVQQAEDTQSCVVQMNELADKITQVHERTDRMNALTLETKNAVEEGVHSVRDLENKVEDSTLCTREIIQEIEALNKASEDISSIVVTMNSIAEETNLLSLNASIEAARAGEAGKGFAVVSEEIRKLAEQSTQAGGRIGEIIMDVQSRVSATMETAIKADGIVEAQTQALDNTISIFEEISQRVTEMENGVEHILHSVDRIESAKSDTLAAIESISATANETEAASSELGNGSSQLLETASQLNEAVQQLRENANDLDSSVKIFKV